jgi:arsenate reductase
MAEVRIYHNPRCSKSRATLALLEEHGIVADVVEYLKSPPSAAELGSILDALGIEPRALMRRDEVEYGALGLDRAELTRSDLIEAMVANPRLIERPIVVRDGKAAIGRPPEAVLAIL